MSGRVELRVDTAVFTRFESVRIERDLQNIAGRFELVALDAARAAAALPDYLDNGDAAALALAPGQACRVSIDGEAVLVGWIDAVHLRWHADAIECRVHGRDRAGDLVDCAALPNGPAEFRGVGLLQVAQTVCAPYGITVRAEVDLGAPFERLSLHPHETALSFLEKAARQRSALLVSDGVGGLLLTRGGATRGPEPLVLGGNVQASEVERSWERRFSDYYVKGQTDAAGGRRKGVKAPLDHTVTPLTSGTVPAATPGPATATERAAVVMTGHATDPEITRYRPSVRMVRTQSGMSSVQDQAEWALRVARGQGEALRYTVLDWRAGETDALWRPNQLVAVYDPYAGLDNDMLIAGVAFSFEEGGAKTVLRVVGRTAYDRINEPERRHRHGHDRRARPHAKLDATVTPLSAP